MKNFCDYYRERWHEYVQLATRLQASGLMEIVDDAEYLCSASGATAIDLMLSVYP